MPLSIVVFGLSHIINFIFIKGMIMGFRQR